eukprot:TRINITY_DN18502_c0_g1_i1.p1 TRINITY_DN18502_c0_g1~~TRINITY_DN18502_c0_g1_i1.p1  ORF type:complete len:328 (-),score=90.45 TRINITY_DN18502_c0_g1_i1:65-949(-)
MGLQVKKKKSQAMEKMLNWTIKVGLGLIAAGAAVTKLFFTVDGGERAIVFDKFQGVKPKVYGEGMHFIIPVIQKPKIYEIRTRPRILHSNTGTRDMQVADISLRILFRPDPNFLAKIFLNLGENYEERVLPSIVNEVLKAVVAQYNADQLLTQREKVSAEIKEILKTRAAEFHIILDDAAITHLQFGKEFTQAIEGKQVAQQNAEKSKFLVMKNEELKKAAIIKAEGEAESAQLIAEAIGKSGPGLIAIRKIEAAQDITEMLARNPNVMFVSDKNPNMLMIPAGPGVMMQQPQH